MKIEPYRTSCKRLYKMRRPEDLVTDFRRYFKIDPDQVSEIFFSLESSPWYMRLLRYLSFEYEYVPWCDVVIIRKDDLPTLHVRFRSGTSCLLIELCDCIRSQYPTIKIYDGLGER